MAVRSHKDLEVWQLSMDLVEQVYLLSRSLPEDERFGLRSQMTRAAVSVPANLAEGNARSSRRDYARFVSLSRGSLMELETYFLLTQRLSWIENEDITTILQIITRIDQMLIRLRQSLLR